MTTRRPALVAGLLAVAVGGALPTAASAAPSAAAAAPSALQPAQVAAAADPRPVTDEVSDLEQGTVLPPALKVAERKTRHAQTGKTRPEFLDGASGTGTPEPGALITGYRTSGIVPPALPVGKRPYDDLAVVPKAGDGMVDEQGVRMFRLASTGEVYNHPVGQSQYAIRNANSYRLTKDPVYLERAVANAQRLVDTRVESGGGWYYPYDFDFAVHNDTTMTLKAPWYSGMAQGQALSAFVRVYQATQDPVWLEAAQATARTLLSAPVENQPFASWVDSEKNLWLEEYPRPDIVSSERVLNGHIFAVYGLYDYWLQTKDPATLRLLDGAVTTNLNTMSSFRSQQWASVYSLLHKRPDKTYHPVHIEQAQMLFQLAGRTSFVKLGNTFRNDFPLRTESGFAELTPSSRVAYRLNASRKVVATRTVRFTRRTGAPVNRRERSSGGPVMLRISAGPYTDWWFPEGFGKAWIRGAKEPHTYSPRQVTAVFTPGTYSAYRYDSAGKRIGAKTITFTKNSSAPTGRSGIVEGRSNYYFTVGAWKGYWVPMSSKILER